MGDAAAAVQAQKILKKPSVGLMIAGLESKIETIAEQKFEITAERVIQELAAIAFANADDFYEWGVVERPLFHKDGAPQLDKSGQQIIERTPYVHIRPSSALTRQQKAAIAGAGMSFSKTGDPVVEVKMGDKRAALRDLGQHLGLFKEQVQHNHTHVIEDAARQLDSRLAHLVARSAADSDPQRLN